MELNFKEELKHVKAFAFDVDGVFSSASVLMHPSGEMLRTSNIKDGYAIYHARKMGYPVAIITGGDSELVRQRFSYLGVEHIYLKSRDKMLDFQDFIKKENLDPKAILYMGDDIPDYPVMKSVGIPTCPEDAAVEIKSVAKYISHRKGGEGCVRDVVEQVLRAQGNWMNAEAFKW
ncbi:MAG: HAD hydrolase family protein [Bacteroidales bacterium]|nr:HAD hydrolase family protein [Bacteroidales bacterium]